MMPAAFEPFLRQAPLAVLARVTVESLFDSDRLDALFEEHAEDQYHRELLFSHVVDLMLSVVLGTKPSLHAAFRDRAGEIRVSAQAVYDKIRCLDLPIAEAVVADSARQLGAVMAQLGAGLPEPLPGYRARIVDGNLLGKTERRLKPLRGSWSRGLPGRVLAVYEPTRDLVTHAFLEADGHASERSRIDDVLALAAPGDVWIADSSFCIHEVLGRLEAARACFVVRQHGSLKGRLLGERRDAGRVENGRVFEQKLELNGTNGIWEVRRVTLALDEPTRDGVTEIHILSNVPASKATAKALAEAYRKRWTVEGRFYEMSQTLNAEPRTLGYPSAALFAFCLGLAASNAAALIRTALRAAHGAEVVAEMSRMYIAREVRETYPGMLIALEPAMWSQVRPEGPEALARLLRWLADWVNADRYRKARRGPKKKPTAKGAYRNGHTLSTQRLLNARQNSETP
jgi:hypothetical protein